MKSSCCDYQVQWEWNEQIFEGCCLLTIVPHYVCGHCLREVEVPNKYIETWIDGEKVV